MIFHRIPRLESQYSHSQSPLLANIFSYCTLMQALLDFTLSSREALQKAVVFLIVSVTGRVLFPVRHAEAASSEAVSVLWVGGRGKIGC